MNSEDATNPSLQQIFLTAKGLVDPQQRAAYLDEVCGVRVHLRSAVERLLEAGDESTQDAEDKATGIGTQTSLPETAQGTVAAAAIDIALHPMIDSYKLLEQLGKGGMGIVYMAQQKQPVKRKVALKLIKPGMDSSEVIARFEAERQALAMMDHPNIARIYDAGVTESGRPYFVMELVRGVPIDQYCDDAILSLNDRLELFINVCRAVQHAHHKGIIHRDLKPSNILVTLHDGVPVVKVIDFGIAKALDQELTERTLFTRFAELVGTPSYMSPEQAEMSGLDVDTRSDVYSLGVLLYKLLVGVTPFDEKALKRASVDELRRIIREDEPYRPSQRISKLDNAQITTISERRGTDARSLSLSMQRELDWIVMRALEKDRNRRYQSASDLAQDIQRYLNDEPVEAFPPSTRYRVKKFARRHKFALLTTSLVLALLITSTGISIWQALRTTSARRLADERLAIADFERRNALAERASADVERRRSQMLLYISDMKLASDALQVGDVPRVSSLLERHRPAAGQEDLRDFAWYFLQKSVSIRRNWRLDVASSVWAIDISPDGKKIAVATQQGQIRIHDVSSGRLLQIFAAQSEFNAVDWDSTGQRIASAGSDGAVRVWDYEAQASDPASAPQAPILRTPALSFVAHQGEVFDVRFTPDGKSLASCGYDGTIRISEADTGRELRTLLGHKRGVERIDIACDGSLLASASSDDTLGLWDLSDGSLKSTWDSPSRNKMMCVAFSPDGSLLAAGDDYGNLVVVEVATGAMATIGQLDGIESVAFLGDSQRLATGDRGGAIHVWSISQGQAGGIELVSSQATPQWTAHAGFVQAIVSSNAAGEIISGGREGSLASWSAHENSTFWECAAGRDFAIQEDGTLLLCNRELSRLNLDTRIATATDFPADGRWKIIQAARACPWIALAGQDGTVKVFDAQQQQQQASWSSPEEPHRMAISPDGRFVAIAFWDVRENVEVFDISDPWNPLVFAARQCSCVAFSPDGRWLAAGSMDALLLYDLRGEQGPIKLVGHTAGLNDCSFSPDGKTIATVSDDRRLKLWDVAAGREMHSTEAHRRDVDCVDFSQDGQILVTGGEDQVIRLWHVETLQPLLEIATDAAVSKVRFGASDRRLIVKLKNDQIIVLDALPNPPALLASGGVAE